MSEKIKIRLPIAVEGKYDKNTLLTYFDATVISLGGFGVFNSSKKQALIRKIAADGIIVLTDSDGGGKVIRSFLNGLIPKDKIFNLYIPQIKGKERRKTEASKEGYLGVEGMNREVLMKVLEKFIDKEARDADSDTKERVMITKVDFYKDKLTGFENSSVLRDGLAERFSLPRGMSANALLEALNIIAGYDEYKRTVDKLVGCQNDE